MRDILYIFYRDKSARFHLREISRQARLHGPSTTRFLKRLEMNGVLRSEKDGNLKKYSMMRTGHAYLIFEAFDIERFGKLPKIKRNGIKTYLDSLPVRPVFAVLFGSTAKGSFKEDSDIDMLLITNERIDAKPAEREAAALTATKISTFQMPYKDFMTEIRMKEDKVVQSAILSGYPLINHLQYYQVLYDERI